MLEVLDALTSEPLADAVATFAGGEPLQAGSDGVLIVEADAPHALPLTVHASGYVGQTLRLEASSPASPRTVRLRPQLVAGSELFLVEGLVIDASGQKVPDAIVYAASPALPASTTAATDGSGRFRLLWAGPGARVRLRAWHAALGQGEVVLDVTSLGGDLDSMPTIVLHQGTSVPVEIRAGGTPSTSAFQLHLTHLPDGFWLPPLQGDRRDVVRDGDLVHLPEGVVVVWLTEEGPEEPVTPRLPCEVVRGSLHLGSLVQVREGDLSASPAWRFERGTQVPRLEFDVARDVALVRVTAAGRPVSGVRLRIEPPEASDPFDRVDTQTPDPEAQRPLALSEVTTLGRRAPLESISEAVTDEAGLARLRWRPSAAARLRIDGPHVPVQYRDIDVTGDSTIDVAIELGGMLDVLWPAWLDACLLVAADQATRHVVRGEVPVSVHPGTYALVTTTMQGFGPRSVRTLADQIQVPAGTVVAVDLRAVEATLILQVVSPVRAAGLLAQWVEGGRPPRPGSLVSPGLVQFESPRLQPNAMLSFEWRDREGHGVHRHLVHVPALTDQPLASTRLHHDLSYEGGGLDLRVTSLSGTPHVLRLEGDPEAPFSGNHAVAVSTPAGTGPHLLSVRDIPPGTYGLRLESNGFHEAVPASVTVEAGRIQTVDIEVRAEHLLVVLMGQDLPESAQLRLQALSDAAGGSLQAEFRHGRARFPRVPPGRYSVHLVEASFDRASRSWGTRSRIVPGEVVVHPSTRRIELQVPPW